MLPGENLIEVLVGVLQGQVPKEEVVVMHCEFLARVEQDLGWQWPLVSPEAVPLQNQAPLAEVVASVAPLAVLSPILVTDEDQSGAAPP